MNKAQTKRRPIKPIANYDASVILLAKEIVSLLSLQLIYSYLNELTLHAGVLYMQPSWYSFSSWPHGDITSLGHSVTWPSLFLQFWNTISNIFKSMHVGFPATQNTLSADIPLNSNNKHCLFHFQ